MTTDKQLSDLFSAGTAPEHDPAFTLEVAARIGRTRLHTRLLALARRAATMSMLAAAIWVAVRLIEPLLTPLIEVGPQFMGVPLPMVLAGAAAVLVLRARRHIPFLFFS